MESGFLGERRTYALGELTEASLRPDPIEWAKEWLAEAERAGVAEPSAMALATVGEGGQPSNRVVLLRQIDHGFVFYTNYESRKGTELASNPYAAAVFWWAELERQLRIEGTVERVSGMESDAYFRARPYESRLASAASPQSRPIADRSTVEREMERLRALGPDIPRPPHWGGYRLLPNRIEFWQGRPARLHDRFEYRLGSSGWSVNRLAP